MNASKLFNAGLMIGVVVAFYATTFHSYLLFHSTIEFVSIVIACGVFMLAWNARRYLEDNYLLFLGISYLFIASLDLLHMLSYKGMGVFTASDANPPTQLWIIARYMESISLFSAFLFRKRRLNVHLLFLCYFLIFVFLLGLVFYWDVFPDCFIDGSGLTQFKIASEYAISVILLMTIVLLVRNRESFDGTIFRLLILSVVSTIVAELAFTFYVSVFGLSNLVGHFFKLLSFYLLYKAIIETGLVKPYELLFRNLKQREEAYRKSNIKLEKEIVERKKVEELLAKSHLEINQIFNGTAEGIRVVDKDYDVVRVNKSFLNYVGLEKGDARRMKCHEMFRGEMCETEDCTLKQIINGQERVERELEKTNPDGKKVFVNLTARPYRDINGELLGVIESFKDVSRRKAIERTVREERDLFMDGFVVVFKWKNQPGWPVEYVSPNTERVLGYSLENVTGLDFLFTDIIAEDDLKWIIRKKNQAIENGLAHEEYEPYRIKDSRNRTRWILDHTRFIKNEQGEVDYFYGYLLDVSNYRANEERLEQQAKLAHAGRLTALGEMASGMAHELNQPMTVLRLGADGLKNYFALNSPGSLEEETVDDIIGQVKRAAKIIKNMRSFSSTNSEVLQSVDIAESVETAISFFREQFRIRQIELETSIESDLPKVRVDPQKFEQIVVNFVSNARYAVEAKSEYAGSNFNRKVSVRLFLSPEKTKVGFEVKDNGAGMSPEVANRCLDPFFTTKKVGDGTGLGLSIVHGIVTEFGLTIEIDTEEGQGCLFRILMPVEL
ncbi:MAG: PAS domain S-box protein [Proteobacteria bacterium]|nr:PAS domain S-box protein [Pseudomonadota bacterium]